MAVGTTPLFVGIFGRHLGPMVARRPGPAETLFTRLKEMTPPCDLP
jgi:hypothetical protein